MDETLSTAKPPGRGGLWLNSVALSVTPWLRGLPTRWLLTMELNAEGDDRAEDRGSEC